MSDRPLFLEHASFRRRRLGDAARVLPVAAALALSLPLLWPGPLLSGAVGAVALFGLWAVLIAATWALHHALMRAEAAGREALSLSDAADPAEARTGDATPPSDPGARPDPPTPPDPRPCAHSRTEHDSDAV